MVKDPAIRAERIQVFLDTLAQTCQIRAAARAAGYSASALYRRRKADPVFANAWDEALHVGLYLMEDEARRRAHDGVDEPLMFRGRFIYKRNYSAIDPKTGEPFDPSHAPIVRDEHGNPMIQTRKTYSDRLMLALLRMHAPEKYGERCCVKVDAPVSHRNLTDEDRAQLIEELHARVAKQKGVPG